MRPQRHCSVTGSRLYIRHTLLLKGKGPLADLDLEPFEFILVVADLVPALFGVVRCLEPTEDM